MEVLRALLGVLKKNEAETVNIPVPIFSSSDDGGIVRITLTEFLLKKIYHLSEKLKLHIQVTMQWFNTRLVGKCNYWELKQIP